MWIRSRCLPSSNNAIRGPWRNDEREMGKSTPATGMMKKREKSDFLKWIRYVSWAKKQKHNLFRHIYSVKRRNHTPIFLRYGTVLPLPLFQLTGKKQKQPNNSGKLVENSMTVSGLCFFRPLFEFIFFLFCFTFINKMAKKKVFRRRWRRFFFLLGFFIYFFKFFAGNTNFLADHVRHFFFENEVHRLFDCNWISVGEQQQLLRLFSYYLTVAKI